MVPLTRPPDTLSPCGAYLSLNRHGARGTGLCVAGGVEVCGAYARIVRL
jgi:hypothetical protein